MIASGCLRCAILFLFACCMLSACEREPSVPEVDPSAYVQLPSDSARVSERRSPPPIAFSDFTQAAGIDFRHETGASGQKWMPESMGSGCALFDYDGDGDLDLLLINGTHWPGAAASVATSTLYRNRGDGRFEDVTGSAGLSFPLYGMGCAAGDYDGDGDLDLYLTAVGENRLLQNQGGRFEDATARAGVAGGRWRSGEGKEFPEWSTGAAWVDVDGDGWIDLFVCNYVRWSPETDLFTTIDGVNKSYATPQPYEGSTCRLYRNRGDGSFEEVTKRAGVYNPKGKSLGVAVADFNGDGHPDLVVTNDTQPNFLYRNRGDGTFEEVGLASGIAYDEAGRARAGMGVDVGSLDNDGKLAIAIGNFSREPVSFYRQAWEDFFIDEAGRRQIARSTLLPLTFGLLFFDYDLDGYLDLVLANGHLEPEINRVQKEITYAQQTQLFWNDGGGRFQDVTDQSGHAFALRVVGRGLAYGDVDGDGDLDLVLATNGGPAVLMRNEGPAGRAVRVHLRGAAPNRQALGAVVTAVAGDLEQRAMVRTGSSYLSQSETTLTFGLGARTRVDRLSVRWPEGRIETAEGLETGATYVVEEGKGIVARIPFSGR